MADVFPTGFLRDAATRLLIAAGLFLAAPFSGTPAGLAHAEDGHVGTILATSGRNLIEPLVGASLVPQAGSSLHARDTIRTGPEGHLQLRFVDGAIVALRPDTIFRIDEYRWPSDEPRSLLSLLRGALRTATGALGKASPQSYRLTTPSATIGVRGTHYVVREVVCEPGCADDQEVGMHVSVREGGLVVSNEAGRIELATGQSARVPGPVIAPIRTAMAPVLFARPMQARAEALTESGPEPGLEPDTTSPVADNRQSGAPALYAATNPESGKQYSLVDRPLANLADSGDANPSESPAPSFAESPAQNPASAPAPDPTDNPEPTAAPTPTPFPAPPEQPAGPRDDGELGGLTDPGGWPTEPPVAAADPPAVPPVMSTALRPGPGMSAASRWRIGLRSPPLASGPDWFGSDTATVSFDEDSTLSSIGVCPGMNCLSRGSARVADAGHDAYAAWGRWTDGSLQATVAGSADTIALSDRESMHYLIGSPATSLPAQGSFTYSMIGATAPTANLLGWAPGSFNGAASVQFAPGAAPRVGLEGQVSIAYETFNFATRGGVDAPELSELRLDAQARFSGTIAGQAGPSVPWYCGPGSCPVQVDGALLGPNGERLGMGYSITSESGSTTIDGVAVFARP